MDQIGKCVLAVVLGVIAALLLRALLHQLNADNDRGAVCNIRSDGRVLRMSIGIILFAIAAIAGWNPLLLFFAGFSIAEAFLGWCAVVAIFTPRKF